MTDTKHELGRFRIARMGTDTSTWHGMTQCSCFKYFTAISTKSEDHVKRKMHAKYRKHMQEVKKGR